MKRNTIIPVIIFLTAMYLSPSCALAQRKAKFLPEHGFWMLVNTKLQDFTTVQFYNDDCKLIYEEKVAHVHFNLNKVRTLRWLKQGLDKAMLAYGENKQLLTDKNWIAAIVKDSAVKSGQLKSMFNTKKVGL